MKIKLLGFHTYYIDCPQEMEDFKCEKFNSNNSDDAWFIRQRYKDSKNKDKFYGGDSEDFREGLINIKE